MGNTDGALSGQVALVTGAGHGIGKAIAVGLADAGAAVGCLARTQPDLTETVREIEGAGGSGLVLAADVTDRRALDSSLSCLVETYGGVDIVVINAGGSLERGPVESSDPDGWKATVELNLVGAYYTARSAIPHLKKRGAGKIIAVGSGMGHRGSQGSSAYSCAKAGLWMLVRVLAQELAPHGISVNELIPGPVATTEDEATLKQWKKRFEELGEWIKKPEDVVPLALFLVTQPTGGPTAQSFSLMRRDN